MKVLLVFAHPDDESFTCGGTVAKLAKEKAQVQLITLTKGEAGQCGEPPVCEKKDLGKIREKELKKAAKILGISKIHFFDYPDGKLKNISSKVLSEHVLKILKSEKPDIVITYNKDGGSLHPDHIKVSRIAILAFEKYLKGTDKHVRLYYSVTPRPLVKFFEKHGLTYQVFGKIKGVPLSQITTLVDIKETLSIKIKALKQHQTQRKDWQMFLKRVRLFNLNQEFFKLVSENEIV